VYQRRGVWSVAELDRESKIAKRNTCRIGNKRGRDGKRTSSFLEKKNLDSQDAGETKIHEERKESRLNFEQETMEPRNRRSGLMPILELRKS